MWSRGLRAARTGSASVPRELDLQELVTRLPTARARELVVADGFLEMCRRNSVGKYSWRLPDSGVILRLYEQCTNADERNELYAAMNLVGRELTRGHRTCRRCLQFYGQCICNLVPNCSFIHRTWVYQHSRQYHTLDNTGKLVLLVCDDPQKSKRVIAGAPEQEREMIESIRASPQTSMVLVQDFVLPKPFTISFQEFRSRQCDSFGDAIADEPLNIVVPDCATMSQFRENVRRIRRQSPPVPFVKIEPESRRSWLDPHTYFHQREVVPTVQILTELFEELGDKPSAKALRSAVSILSASREHGIQVRIDGKRCRSKR